MKQSNRSLTPVRCLRPLVWIGVAFSISLSGGGCSVSGPSAPDEPERAADASSAPLARSTTPVRRDRPEAAPAASGLPDPSSNGYRLESGPVVVFAVNDGVPVYAAYLRLNKDLPKGEALVLLDGSGYDTESVGLSSRVSHCYTYQDGGDELASTLVPARDGRRVTVTVGRTNESRSRAVAVYLTARVVARRVSLSQINNGAKFVVPRLRRLGCKHPTD